MVVLVSRKIVCDVCENPRRNTTTYRLGHPSDIRSFTLCREDAAPLEKLISSGLGRTLPTASGPRVTVTTLEEIEEQKAAQRGKTPPQTEV